MPLSATGCTPQAWGRGVASRDGPGPGPCGRCQWCLPRGRRRAVDALRKEPRNSAPVDKDPSPNPKAHSVQLSVKPLPRLRSTHSLPSGRPPAPRLRATPQVTSHAISGGGRRTCAGVIRVRPPRFPLCPAPAVAHLAAVASQPLPPHSGHHVLALPPLLLLRRRHHRPLCRRPGLVTETVARGAGGDRAVKGEGGRGVGGGAGQIGGGR